MRRWKPALPPVCTGHPGTDTNANTGTDTNANTDSNHHIIRTKVRAGKEFEDLCVAGWILRVRELRKRHHRRIVLLLSKCGGIHDDTNFNSCHYDNFHVRRIVQTVVCKQSEELGQEMQVGQVCRMLFMLHKTAPGK